MPRSNIGVASRTRAPARLDCWSTALSGDGYVAPEVRRLILVGHVYGHPKFPDGHKITSSPVVAARGRRVTTTSGRVYLLLNPDPVWLAWMRTNGIAFGPDEPVKAHR